MEVTLRAQLNSEGSVTNTSQQAQNFTFSTRAQAFTGTLSGGGPVPLPDPFEAVSSFTLIAEQEYTALAAGVATNFGPGTLDTGVQILLASSDPLELAAFLGTGDFGYDFDTSILTIIQGGGGNASTDITTLASAILTVEYTFDEPPQTVIPEPGTVMLVGLGMVGLAAFGRKRMAK